MIMDKTSGTVSVLSKLLQRQGQAPPKHPTFLLWITPPVADETSLGGKSPDRGGPYQTDTPHRRNDRTVTSLSAMPRGRENACLPHLLPSCDPAGKTTAFWAAPAPVHPLVHASCSVPLSM